MAPDVARLLIGHMGCYAAMPGLAAVSDYVTARGRPAVLLCLELTSLHGQPPSPTVSERDQTFDDVMQMVAHSLFADAASAIVLVARHVARPGRLGPRLRGARLRHPHGRQLPRHMAWDITDLGFKMVLSPKVPDVLAVHVGDVVDELLGRNGLRRRGRRRLGRSPRRPPHPRGRRGAARARADAAMAASYGVLRDFGNCSSATVLLVIERLFADRVADDAPVVAMAFGPGLTLYAALLRRRA